MCSTLCLLLYKWTGQINSLSHFLLPYCWWYNNRCIRTVTPLRLQYFDSRWNPSVVQLIKLYVITVLISPTYLVLCGMNERFVWTWLHCNKGKGFIQQTTGSQRHRHMWCSEHIHSDFMLHVFIVQWVIKLIRWSLFNCMHLRKRAILWYDATSVHIFSVGV